MCPGWFNIANSILSMYLLLFRLNFAPLGQTNSFFYYGAGKFSFSFGTISHDPVRSLSLCSSTSGFAFSKTGIFYILLPNILCTILLPTGL
jgi:hypothetical protein